MSRAYQELKWDFDQMLESINTGQKLIEAQEAARRAIRTANNLEDQEALILALTLGLENTLPVDFSPWSKEWTGGWVEEYVKPLRVHFEDDDEVQDVVNDLVDDEVLYLRTLVRGGEESQVYAVDEEELSEWFDDRGGRVGTGTKVAAGGLAIGLGAYLVKKWRDSR